MFGILATLAGFFGGSGESAGGRSGGSATPTIPDVLAIIFNIFGISFPTHRPDSSELPDGTQWLHGSPDAGVIQTWFGDYGKQEFRWKGEILATADTDFPIAAWDYAQQTFMPILGISPDGACNIVDETAFNTDYQNPDCVRATILTNPICFPGWDYIAMYQSPRDQYANKYICEEIRGGSWAAMEADGAYYAEAAMAHGIPFAPQTAAQKVANVFGEGTPLRAALKVGGSVLGTVAGVAAIVKVVKQ